MSRAWARTSTSSFASTLDLLANTSDLLLSLTNRIYAKRGDAEQEVVSWEIMQKRYFDPTFGGALISGQEKRVRQHGRYRGLCVSGGAASGLARDLSLTDQPVRPLRRAWEADYDPRYHGIVNSTFSLDDPSKNYFASIGNNSAHTDPLLIPAANQYRYRLGFGDPNHRGWNAGLDGVYDYRAAEILYSKIQATYNTDCCGFSVQYYRFKFGVRDHSQWRVAFPSPTSALSAR